MSGGKLALRQSFGLTVGFSSHGGFLSVILKFNIILVLDCMFRSCNNKKLFDIFWRALSCLYKVRLFLVKSDF